MSGIRRLIVGDITQRKNLRGKALSDALCNELCSEEQATSAVKKTVNKTYARSRKK